MCDKRANKKLGRSAMGWFRMLAAAAILAAAGSASAQPFPSKPVRILVPYAAGGAVDILSRTLGDAVSQKWGQSVVIENRPGAGGVIASQALVTSPPDGYTLIVVASGHPTNPFLYAKLPYDTFKDFTPISQLASSPNILLVRADSPFKTVADMIAAAKAKPGTLTYGHAGTGTSTHLAGELLKNLAKIDISGIPYKGGLPAINDLLGGQIALSFNNGPESVGQLQAGTVRALAVTTGKRAPFLPNVPAIGETVPGYDTEVWWGLLGPGNMPRDLVEKLSRDFVAALNTDSVKERLGKLGAAPIGSTPAGIRCQNPCRLRQMGPDHPGRRHQGGVNRPPHHRSSKLKAVHVRQQQARFLRQISRSPDLHRNPQSPSRRAARPARERDAGIRVRAGALGRACLSGRRRARRNRAALPRP
jgi:tripartite-type tricarboxylate transporter receptor subunit TctC